ncbi:MAG: AAA-like domain-containing protein [Oscillospiraceae bacterium]|jgi:hypothetical protein|nr:AAA-like domain-containing protein [Oscillospiraceae bacterium]
MAGKRFNITGVCNPTMHYMVDTSAKIEKIVRDYVEPGEYFVINRARQYGKTTTLRLLSNILEERYLLLQLSFEGSEGYFESQGKLVNSVCAQIASALKKNYPRLAAIVLQASGQPDAMDDFSDRITSLCAEAGKPVILMIDEVDRATDYGVFASFLGLLRKKYLARKTPDDGTTFHNVILAGVHDVKNLKAKIRQDSEHAYNSPWNIAASFDVDMSFSAPEIATMLSDYEADYRTGMDIEAVAARLYYHTSGYPFLVSALCKIIHDEKMDWSIDGVDNAVKRILVVKNTLFDDIIKNMQNHPGFAKLVERIILEGKKVEYNPDDPNIQIGIMYGIFTERDNQVHISNLIFATRLMNYFISISETNLLVKERSERDASLYVKNGSLDFNKVLERFSVFMADEYRDQDSKFIEREARRLLIGYIKPIINGQGQYFLEPEIRGGQRIDLLVQYKRTEYIIEVKIWRGDSYEKRAYDQIARYVKARHGKAGYVVSFCDMRTMPRKGTTFEHDGVTIHEVIVAYKDTV